MSDCKLRANTFTKRRAAYYRDADVHDIAREILRLMRVLRAPVALFVHPDDRGEFMLTTGAKFHNAIHDAPASLVGVYEDGITEDEIVADVLAMPRGTEAGA